MTTARAAIAVLAETETKLRELVGRAAAGGEYDVAVKIATAAKSVAALAIAFNGKHQQQEPSPTPTADSGGEGRTDSPAPAPPRRAVRRRAKRAGRLARGPKKGVYPKFFREGDYLVKVAWSKKDRGEYQHKAPRRVVHLLAAAIEKRSRNGRLFTSEDVFPLKDPQSGGDVPSYQAYAALAWFRQTGLVRAHGRRGYTAKEQTHLSELLTAAWQNLPESPD